MASTKIYHTSSNRRARDIDGPYSCLVTVASLSAHMLIYGVMWSSGVFYDIFREMFDSGSGTISVIATLSTACTFGISPVTGILINRYGHRTMTIIGGLISGCGLVLSAYATNIYYLMASFGALTGMGFGISYLAVIAIVPLYFEKWRTVALGVAVSGVGLGTFIYPPIIRILVGTYGVRGALLITGGVTFNLCLCGAVMRAPNIPKKTPEQSPEASPTKEYSNSTESGRSDDSPLVSPLADSSPRAEKFKMRSCIKLLNIQIFKNFSYLVLCVNNFLVLFGICIVYVHITAFSETSGISKDMAALLISTIGISNFVGRPLFGGLAKIPCFSALSLFTCSLVLCGVVVLITPLVSTFTALVGMMSLFGLLSGSIGPLLPQLISEFLSLSLIPSAYGYLLVFEAVGSILGPAIAGYLYDSLHLYVVSLYLAGAAIATSGLVMIVPYTSQKMADRRASKRIIESVDVDSSPTNSCPNV